MSPASHPDNFGRHMLYRHYLRKDCCHQSLGSTCVDLGYSVVEVQRWVIVNIRMSSGQSIMKTLRVRVYIEVGSVAMSDATTTEGIYACINPRYIRQ